MGVMATTSVYQHTDYREYLNAYFAERKGSDPKFSHRYLGRRLGLSSPNFIMMVMQGKRNLTRPMAFRISQEFKHNPKEAEYFESMVGLARARSTAEKDRYFTRMAELRRRTDVAKIEESQYEYYSNWYNLVIRELVTYPEFKGDIDWLAKSVRPPITPKQARRSVELLLELGFIVTKGSTYLRRSAVISTGLQVSSLAVTKFHRTMAQRAAEAMDTVPKRERDMTACTVSISEKGFEQVKEVVTDCRKKIMAIAEANSPPERVYQVNFHVFPVSASTGSTAAKE
jgi:uncharacterized protein (TIGR02147 family)